MKGGYARSGDGAVTRTDWRRRRQTTAGDDPRSRDDKVGSEAAPLPHPAKKEEECDKDETTLPTGARRKQSDGG